MNKTMKQKINQRYNLRIIYLGVVVILSLILFSWFTLDPLKYPIATFLREGGSKQALPRFILTLLHPYDFALLVLAGLGVIVFLLWELKNKELSQALTKASDFQFLLFASILLLWLTHSYFHPGYLLGGDTNFHVARIVHFRLALEQGKFLFWDNYWNLGVPELQFTGPLLFWLGGFIDYLIKDPYLTVKLILFTTHILSAWLCYMFLRQIGLSRLPALVGMIIYGGAWAHLHLLLYKGVLPQAITLLLLPLGLLLIEKVIKEKHHFSFWWACLTFVNSALLINHPTNGMFVGLYIVIYTLINLIIGRYSWHRLLPLVTSGLLGVMMTAFVIVPMLAEQQWVTMTDTGRLVYFQWPHAGYFRYLLTWSNTKTGPGSNFDAYVGLSSVALALIGIYAAVRKRREAVKESRFIWLFLILLLLSIYMKGPHIRNIIFTLFFIAVLAANGAQYLLNNIRSDSHVPALLILILLFDLGPAAIQPLARTDKTYFATAANYLETSAPSERVLQGDSRDGKLFISLWNGSPLLPFPVQQLGLPNSYSATVFHNYGAAIIKTAERDLQTTGYLSEKAQQGLALMNVTRLISSNGLTMSLPDSIVNAVEEGPLGKTLHIPWASPVVFSPRLQVLVPKPEYDKPVLWDDVEFPDHSLLMINAFIDEVFAQMGYHPEEGFADALAVREMPALQEIIDAPKRWNKKVLAYQVNIDRVWLKLYSEHPGYIQLSHTWYPYLLVIHNGQPVIPLRSTMNLIVLPVADGLNEYSIVPVRSHLRVLVGWFSVGIALLVALLPWLSRLWLSRDGSGTSSTIFR